MRKVALVIALLSFFSGGLVTAKYSDAVKEKIGGAYSTCTSWMKTQIQKTGIKVFVGGVQKI